MSGLPLSPEGFSADGRAAAAVASSDRATAGHRRPAADANAFGEIVSALAGPAAARPVDRGGLEPAATAATPGRPRLTPSMTLPAEPIPGGDTSDAARGDTASTARTVGAGAPSLAGPGRAGATALALSFGGLAGADSLEFRAGPGPGPGEGPAVASLHELGAAARSTAIGGIPHPGDADHRLTGRRLASLDPHPRAAEPAAATRLQGVSVPTRSEDAFVGLAATAADGSWAASADAAAAPVPALEAIAAAPTPVATGAGALDAATTPPLADFGFGPSTGAAPTTAGDATTMPGTAAALVDPGTRSSIQDSAPRLGASVASSATPSPQGILEPGAAGSRPAPGRLDGDQAAVPGTGGTVAPSAGPDFPAPAAGPSRSDAPAPKPGAAGGRASARVLEMRTHFAPVVARPLDRQVEAEPTAAPTTTATAETATATTAAMATATEAEVGLARRASAASTRAPWAAPADGRTSAAATATPAARSDAPPPVASPLPIGPGVPREASVPPVSGVFAQAQATAAEALDASPAGPTRAASEGPPRAGERQATRSSNATSPDLRTGPLPEPKPTDPVARRSDPSAASADDGPSTVAAEAVGPAPTSSPGAGSAMDQSLRTLAQDIGRAARPLATGDTAAAATGVGTNSPMLRRDVEVELSAPEFGVVRVRMRLHGSSLELSLRTDDPAMLGLLADRRAELERSIAETGVDVKVVDVSRTSGPTPSSSSPQTQAPTGDSGRSGDGQRFEQQSSPDRNDRRSPSDRSIDGTTHDEDPTSRAGARAGTLFV